MNIIEIVEKTFGEYCGEFSKILEEDTENGGFGFKPWLQAWNDKKRRSIHESNQVYKFMEAYKETAPNPSKVLTWMELPVIVGETRPCTHHIDGFIVDNERKILFFLEAKRLSRKSNYESLNCDVGLLYDFRRYEYSNFKGKICDSYKGLNLLEYDAFAICLVDIWKDKSSWTKEKVEKWGAYDDFSLNPGYTLKNGLKEVYPGYFQGYYLMPFFNSKKYFHDISGRKPHKRIDKTLLIYDDEFAFEECLADTYYCGSAPADEESLIVDNIEKRDYDICEDYKNAQDYKKAVKNYMMIRLGVSEEVAENSIRENDATLDDCWKDKLSVPAAATGLLHNFL